MRLPTEEMPSLYMMSNSHSLKGRGHLVLDYLQLGAVAGNGAVRPFNLADAADIATHGGVELCAARGRRGLSPVAEHQRQSSHESGW